MTTKSRPEPVRTRIERAFRAHTGAESSHGAIGWFAERARITREHASRIASGRKPLDGPILTVLELLEREAKEARKGERA